MCLKINAIVAFPAKDWKKTVHGHVLVISLIWVYLRKTVWLTCMTGVPYKVYFQPIIISICSIFYHYFYWDAPQNVPDSHTERTLRPVCGVSPFADSELWRTARTLGDTFTNVRTYRALPGAWYTGTKLHKDFYATWYQGFERRWARLSSAHVVAHMSVFRLHRPTSIF